MSKMIREIGEYIMSMSANILRNLVSRVFDTTASKVILSGEINPNYSITNHEGVSYMDSSESKVLHGFNPKTGFKLIPEVVTTVTYFNGNHDHSTELGCELSEVVGIDEFIFFVEIQEGYNSDGDFKYVTLYKAPNFKEYWEKINEEDLARWEQWLNDTITLIEGKDFEWSTHAGNTRFSINKALVKPYHFSENYNGKGEYPLECIVEQKEGFTLEEYNSANGSNYQEDYLGDWGIFIHNGKVSYQPQGGNISERMGKYPEPEILTRLRVSSDTKLVVI